MMTPAVLSAALLLLLLQEGCCCCSCPAGVPPSSSEKKIPFTVVVSNSITPGPNKTFNTYVHYRGILIGGLRRLQDSKTGFMFTYTEDYNYGPFLQSVNCLAGDDKDKTYWQLLVKKTDNKTKELDVGIGCYLPDPKDQIILNYRKYEVQQNIINHPELQGQGKSWLYCVWISRRSSLENLPSPGISCFVIRSSQNSLPHDDFFLVWGITHLNQCLLL